MKLHIEVEIPAQEWKVMRALARMVCPDDVDDVEAWVEDYLSRQLQAAAQDVVDGKDRHYP